MTRKSGQQNNTANPSPPVSTPDFGGSPGWSLQALVDLKTEIAKLTVSVENLSGMVVKTDQSVGRLETRIDKVERRILVAATAVGLIVGAGGFVANKAIDFGLDMAKKSFEMQITNANQANKQQQPAPPAQK